MRNGCTGQEVLGRPPEAYGAAGLEKVSDQSGGDIQCGLLQEEGDFLMRHWEKEYHDVTVEEIMLLMSAHYYEPKVCSHFGCGKKLSLREELFGSKCIDHSINENKTQPEPLPGHL